MPARTSESTLASGKSSDVRVKAAELFLLPVETRVPLKFGAQTLTSVVCARARVVVVDRDGKEAVGWGETPLSAQWAWPSQLGYALRSTAMENFCRQLTFAWTKTDLTGHPIEIGAAFTRLHLPVLLETFNDKLPGDEPMPFLAALICCAPFDIALHDAFGHSVDKPIYQTYCAEYMNLDLHDLLQDDDHRAREPFENRALAKGSGAENDFFRNKYPCDFLLQNREQELLAWHLVGGLDPLEECDLLGDEPRDGHPVLLGDWIARDGLKCLKIKLRGNDLDWDRERILRVGRIAQQYGADDLTTDFNCTVSDPSYVMRVLDDVEREAPNLYENILYVEQPFPYDLAAHPIDVHEVAARKPLLMDESADSWRQVRMGRQLGWNGVALKTCKTQSGALLSFCWARAHNMHIMVQDLTNPMLAQIPHLLLAAHVKTMRGVESNSMQFYPEASRPEAQVHPGAYQRRNGVLDLSSIRGAGFGYRVDEISRQLPPSAPAN